MDWIQVLTIVGSNLAIMLTFFGVSIGLYVHIDRKIEEGRKETNEILRSIVEEMKDFHGRLCAIEEKSKK